MRTNKERIPEIAREMALRLGQLQAEMVPLKAKFFARACAESCYYYTVGKFVSAESAIGTLLIFCDASMPKHRTDPAARALRKTVADGIRAGRALWRHRLPFPTATSK